ncbi:MAG: cadherin-like domain-containing protein [Pseudomonadota bacterium]
MTAKSTVIDRGTTLTGLVEGKGYLEVFGTIEGELIADHVVVRPGGHVIGRCQCRSATVSGSLQGEIDVTALMDIAEDGQVAGKVRYGTLQLARGGILDANVSNVPPTVVGDRQIEVARGASVAITTRDLSAVDPDDGAADIRFAISGEQNGWIALEGARDARIVAFTKADLQAGRVRFIHDGAQTQAAAFSVVAQDASGGTSGTPVTIDVVVE